MLDLFASRLWPLRDWPWSPVARYRRAMMSPSDDQLAALEAAFEAFARRYKLAEALDPEKPLNELDKQVLFFVARHPGCGPSDVARFLGVPSTTITSASDRMVKRGFLERARPERDRRAVALRLTGAGAGRVEGLLGAYRALHLRMLAPLTADERDALIGLMQKIISNED